MMIPRLIYSIFACYTARYEKGLFVMWRWSLLMFNLFGASQKAIFWPFSIIQKQHASKVKENEKVCVELNQSLITRSIKSSNMFYMQLKLNCKWILNPSESSPHDYMILASWSAGTAAKKHPMTLCSECQRKKWQIKENEKVEIKKTAEEPERRNVR